MSTVLKKMSHIWYKRERNPLHLMVRIVVSGCFCLQPNHWNIIKDPSYPPAPYWGKRGQWTQNDPTCAGSFLCDWVMVECEWPYLFLTDSIYCINSQKNRHGRSDTSQRKWGWITCPFVCWRLIINEGSSFARNINNYIWSQKRKVSHGCPFAMNSNDVMQVALATGRLVVRLCSRLTQTSFSYMFVNPIIYSFQFCLSKDGECSIHIYLCRFYQYSAMAWWHNTKVEGAGRWVCPRIDTPWHPITSHSWPFGNDTSLLWKVTILTCMFI